MCYWNNKLDWLIDWLIAPNSAGGDGTPCGNSLPDFWPTNSPGLNTFHYKIWGSESTTKKRRMWMIWGSICSMHELECNRALLMINVKKTVVYLQLITVKWHIENSKNSEWWYYFSSTLPLSTCFWSNITVNYFCCFRCHFTVISCR